MCKINNFIEVYLCQSKWRYLFFLLYLIYYLNYITVIRFLLIQFLWRCINGYGRTFIRRRFATETWTDQRLVVGRNESPWGWVVARMQVLVGRDVGGARLDNLHVSERLLVAPHYGDANLWVLVGCLLGEKQTRKKCLD